MWNFLLFSICLQKLTAQLYNWYSIVEYWLNIVNVQTLQGALLSCAYTMLDYAQTGLIAAVFIFKVSVVYLLQELSTLN